MASAVLHIKDSYYVEVPKSMWRSNRQTISEFPDVWVRLDPTYQHWEASVVHAKLKEAGFTGLPDESAFIKEYEHWRESDHANFARPVTAFLTEGPGAEAFLGQLKQKPELNTAWRQIRSDAGSHAWIQEFASDETHEWSPETIASYNRHLSGKVLISQPFGRLRNLYQAESGFCISKFMVLEVAVALIVAAVFAWLGSRFKSSMVPRGRIWNLLEAVLLFLRDEVARPAIGKHDADRFVPLLWTIFLFVLGCNLIGMVPWAGTPTTSWSVTLTLALITFGTVIISGSLRFGWVGFWLNQVPSMDLPFVMALFIKPALFLIEVIGLFIKHAVLSIRLLANMLAGHMVLVSILFLAFSHEAVAQLEGVTWAGTAIAAVLGSALLSCLELFVAFLQAYIFTFLSALFIGAAVHHH